jgi:hypothetical protein
MTLFFEELVVHWCSKSNWCRGECGWVFCRRRWIRTSVKGKDPSEKGCSMVRLRCSMRKLGKE